MFPALEKYIAILKKTPAVSAKVLNLCPSVENKITFSDVPEIAPDLKMWFSSVDGYDEDLCLDLDIDEPEFIWGMHLLSLKESKNHYDELSGCGEPENPDYWPTGFIPILWGGAGDYVLINSLIDSPTCGAVYEMTDGIGVNRISKSISDFLRDYGIILERKLIKYENPEMATIADFPKYLDACKEVFADSAYFAR